MESHMHNVHSYWSVGAAHEILPLLHITKFEQATSVITLCSYAAE